MPGGENDFGEAEPYNASQLAADQRAIVASMNYRVGPFGFAALAWDRAKGITTGNHALTDIQAALKFLRAHVGVFGGDPSRLTIFGQSSGGALALLHSVMPSSSKVRRISFSLEPMMCTLAAVIGCRKTLMTWQGSCQGVTRK